LVNAPLEAVRKLAMDYGHYKDIAPSRFHNSRVVGKQAGDTDVYLQVAIMHGAVMLWDVTRFHAPLSVAPGVEKIEGRHIKGNLKDLHVVWTLRAINPRFTVVKCDILLVLNMAAPQSAIDEELRDAAEQAVGTVWLRAQNGERRVVPFTEGGNEPAAPAPPAPAPPASAPSAPTPLPSPSSSSAAPSTAPAPHTPSK
jgi:hypothetical protein